MCQFVGGIGYFRSAGGAGSGENPGGSGAVLPGI